MDNLKTYNITLSPSSISTYQACPRKFKYQKIDKLKIDTDQSEALVFGSLVHLFLETFISIPDWDNLKTLNNELFSFYDKPEYIRGEITELVKRGLKELTKLQISILPEKLVTYQTELETGQRGNGIYDPETGVRLYLKIDLVAKDLEENTIIVDWKTTSWDYDRHKIISSFQLDMYAYAYRLLYGKLPNKVVYITFNKKTMVVESLEKKVEQRHIDEVRQKILQVKKAINNEIFYKNENNCTMRIRGEVKKCPFYNLCWAERQVKVNRFALPTFGKT